MVHPRLYWGEAGNDLTPALIELPISRNYQHGGWDSADAVLRGRRRSGQREPDLRDLQPERLGAEPALPGRVVPRAARGSCTCWSASLAATSGRTSGRTRAGTRAASRLARRRRSPAAADSAAPAAARSTALLQKCAYSVVVFVAAPLMALTGLTMSPAVTAAFPFLLGRVRRLPVRPHDPLLHVRCAPALRVRARRDDRHVRIPTSDAGHDRWGNDMKTSGLITRRRAIVTGLAAAGGFLVARASQGSAADLRQPAAHGRHVHVRGASRAVAGAVAGEGIHTAGHHVVSRHRHDRPRRRSTSQGSATPTGGCRAASSPTGGCRSRDESPRPRSFSLADLKRLPSRTQITRHTCEEGWTAIGQWTGVPLSLVLDAAGMLPTREVRGLLLLRRLGRQHRPARRPAPADDPRLRHERTRSPDPARRAGAAAGRTPDWATRA